MNKLSVLDSSKVTFQFNEYSAPLLKCDRRCQNCPLFPYELLKEANVIHTENLGNFVINDAPRKLSAQGVRLLCSLVRQNNQILPIDYLISYVWPGSSIVRNNLNVAIYDLRIFLSETAINIANHRKQGYSLSFKHI